ncbi:TaqI-like C-terminal specificity domain-containing protein [Clostridiaceae bacterium M8S5]|nr:TaqI-like C-terminal specificity domain-containing protein [Clostridiaceae bacterium M8S5]
MLKDKLKVLIKQITSEIAIDKIDEYIDLKKAVIYLIGIKLLCIRYSINQQEVLKGIKLDPNNKYLKNKYLNKEHQYKLEQLINRYKNEIDSFSLGRLYEDFITSKERKYLGQVYTPAYIIDEMIDISIKNEDIISNPHPRIIDPSCGGGYFCTKLLRKLKSILIHNKTIIQNKHPEYKNTIFDDIEKYIIENCLWAADIDEFAVFLTKVDLLLSYTGNKFIRTNVYHLDILIGKNEHIKTNYFDLVIGNPPYIGHKKLPLEYKKLLKLKFPEIFSDKSDISYCFFKIGYDLLKTGKTLTYITSRYFLEAPSAKYLRNFLRDNMSINRIIDFYGHQAFEKIGISPAIINCTKADNAFYLTNIIRYRNKNSFKVKKLSSFPYKFFDIYTVDKFIDDKWLLIKEEEKKLYGKIDSQLQYRLRDICESKQGIITGCDKAFVVDMETIEKEKLERDVIYPWVKNSQINKYCKINTDRYIIYTNKIKDIAKYPNIHRHILPYKSKLNNRRECKRNIRRWHELQWGRNIDLLIKQKLMFPYKSKANTFTLDDEGILNSADIYCLTSVKKSVCSIYYLLGILNSILFEFYFKCIAKKLTANLYDYYPNKIMELGIKVKYHDEISTYVKELLKLSDTDYNFKMIETRINTLIFEIYGINKNEVQIINNRVNISKQV